MRDFVDKKILSIVVPTKNRFDYAIYCITSLLKLDLLQVEIVIVDNSDGDELYQWLLINKHFDFCNYVRVNEKIPVSQNYQKGIDAASGSYICTIGDDDTVNPEIVKLVFWMQQHNIDALTPKFIVDYVWPDIYHNENREKAGKLSIRQFSGKMQFPSVEKGLLKLVHSCGTDLSDTFYLPKIYYGIIKANVLRKAKDLAHSNFPGVSPDLSGAVTSAQFINKYCVFDYPIFIPGSSKKSTAGLSMQKKHKGSLYDQPHISKEAIDTWPEFIPKYFSVESVWSQSAYVSLQQIKRIDLLERFNFPRIYAYSFMFNPSFYKMTFSVFNSYRLAKRENALVLYAKLLKEYINYIFIRFRYLIKNKTNFLNKSLVLIVGPQNIEAASLEALNYLKKKNISIDHYLKG
jgi:glycosyltransferase involved in cell wall biosynthesis